MRVGRTHKCCACKLLIDVYEHEMERDFEIIRAHRSAFYSELYT